MKKVILIILALVLALTGCGTAKPIGTPSPAKTPDEPVSNAGNVKPNVPMGITVNKIAFKTIETNAQLNERGFVVEPTADGYHITICSGKKPSAGFGITVKLVEDNEGKTNIIVEETNPPAGHSSATVITYPTTAISIGKSIAPNFHISNTTGDIFQQLSLSKSPTLPSLLKENAFAVTPSDKMPGWNQLKARVILQGLTEDGSKPLENQKMFSYSFHFPGTWKFDGSSVFYDSNNKKIAEIPPAVFLLPEQNSVFLEYKPDMNMIDELVSQQKITLNSYSGSKTIIKIMTESGSWYPHLYRLSNGTNGFCLNLYSVKINEQDQNLFDKIAGTFQIEQ